MRDEDAFHAAHLQAVQLLDQGPALAGQLEDLHAAIARMIAPQHELLFLQTVDDVGDGGQRDAEGFGHVAHVDSPGDRPTWKSTCDWA